MDSDERKILAAAVMYRERHGFSTISMSASKVPTGPWKEFQDRLPTITEIIERPQENLAVVTGSISGIVIVDCESKDDALWFYDHRCKTSAIVQTRRGFHLYYRHPGVDVRNAQKVRASEHCSYDVRGDGGYALLPPSKHSEGSYSWYKKLTKVADLPEFDPKWRPTAEPRYDDNGDHGRVRDVYRYIAKIHAVSGSGGHDRTFEVARLLAESGMSQDEAVGAIMAWNATNADPPWRESELRHKISSAYR
jgi:hypothetical protein